MKVVEHKEASLQGSYFSQRNLVPKERSLWLQRIEAARAHSKSLIFFFFLKALANTTKHPSILGQNYSHSKVGKE